MGGRLYVILERDGFTLLVCLGFGVFAFGGVWVACECVTVVGGGRTAVRFFFWSSWMFSKEKKRKKKSTSSWPELTSCVFVFSLWPTAARYEQGRQ